MTVAVWVAAVDRGDIHLLHERLAHGDAPEALLARHGLTVVAPRTVVAQRDPHEVTIVYEVTRDRSAEVSEAGVPPHDADLVVQPGEQSVVVQRLAVYALVRSARGYLLTENSARTNAPGTWALPGGGLDPGELPEAALHREVWEESGQRIRVEDVAAVTTRHWVGRSPNGRLEDFHAVRLVYRATCDEPTDPVVHDVDGTTAAAAWFGVDEIRRLPLALGTSDTLRRLTADGA